MKTQEDIAIEKIRESRKRISAEHGHDPKKIVEHYGKLEKKYAERIERQRYAEPAEPVKI